jgi:hypothetical protein
MRTREHLSVGAGRIGDESNVVPLVWRGSQHSPSRRALVVSPEGRVLVGPPPVVHQAVVPGCGADRLRAAYGLDPAPPPLVNVLA